MASWALWPWTSPSTTWRDSVQIGRLGSASDELAARAATEACMQVVTRPPCTHPSIAAFFMIVSFPEDAAAATCCSMLLLIFALSS